MQTDKLEDVAVIQEVHDDYVLVEMLKSASCDACGLSGFCHGKDRVVRHKIVTQKKFEVGDKVKINISPSLRIASSLLVFLVPILAMIIFYSIFKYVFTFTESISILAAFCGLVLSGFFIYKIDKKIEKKIKFEITEKRWKYENSFE